MDGSFLEVSLDDLNNGQRVDVVFTIVQTSPGGSVCCTKIHNQIFMTEYNFPTEYGRFAVLQAVYDRKGSKHWLRCDDTTVVVPHLEPTMSKFPGVIEACAGIGAVGRGFAACGVETTCFVDNNKQFCRWLQVHQSKPIIEGDIADPATVAKVAGCIDGEHLLSGGVSCQPFSGLGDKREQHDSRSRSFPALLRMGFFLNVVAIIMECTKEVMQSEWAQKILRNFGDMTGYKVVQNVIHLHRTWPSYRTRWWAVVSHPALPQSSNPAMPDLSFEPGVIHVIPRMLKLEGNALTQIECDLYELRGFHTVKGGVHTCILNMLKPMPTATHSWGSRLTFCHCGCRSSGFSSRRLQESGLYGIVWPLNESVWMNGEEITRLRHLHPQEVSVLCGLTPDHIPGKQEVHTRLSLAGVGQLASPLQSAWVIANFFQSVGADHLGFEVVSPKRAILKVVEDIFRARDRIWGIVKPTKYMEIFAKAITQLLQDDEEESNGENGILSQDTLTTVKQAEIALSLSGSSLEGQEGVNSSFERSSPIVHEVSQAHEGDEDIGITDEALALCLQRNAEVPQSDHVEFEDGYDEGHWECPYGDCVICDPDIVVAKPNFFEDQVAVPGNDHEAISATLPFSIQGGDPQKSEAVESPFNVCGGIKAFTTKRDFREVGIGEQEEKESKIARTETHETTLTGVTGRPLAEKQDHDNDTPKSTRFSEIKAEQNSIRVLPSSHQSEEAEVQGVMPDGLDQSDGSHVVQVFTNFEESPFFLRINKDASVGSITVAEDELRTMQQPIGIRNAVGQPLPLASKTTPFQQIFLHYVPEYAKCQTAHHAFQGRFEPDQWVSRLHALQQQESCVAVDEMMFYLSNIGETGSAVEFAPFAENEPMQQEKPCEDCDPETLQLWVDDFLGATQETSKPLITAVLKHNHWMPFVAVRDQTAIRVFTSPEGMEFFNSNDVGKNSQVELYSRKVPQVFNNDCGFQCIGWLLHVATDLTVREAMIGGETPSIPPFPVSSAVAWRGLFEHHLLVSLRSSVRVQPCKLLLGGALVGDTPEKQIAGLLQQHGVPESEAASRAKIVIEKLGRSAILQALRSERPWAELKSVANQQSPKFQLVLPSELENAIRARANAGKSFGDKKQKIKGGPGGQQKGPVVLQPCEVSIPDGLFKQGEDQLIRQISLSSIRKDASGIVVVNASQAEPYLKLSQPLSSHGLALLVLDHHDPICNGAGQVIRFPGRCEKTGEPFIGTGRLIQLGSIEVCRHFPATQVKVDEVETQVLRAVVYRDEIDGEWQEFSQKPVKFVLEHLGIAGGGEEDGVIDVWDRQWLSHKMERQKPQKSDIFMVSFRLTGKDEQVLMGKSGDGGVYLEPRTADGRSPSDRYRVMWLPRTDKATTMTSLQAAQTWACLVRSGKRFGLRTVTSDAQKVHDQYKPQVPFLDAASVLHYVVGPFPYGVTKSNLGKVFATWSWQARPVQPRGRSSDGAGILWEVHASQPPECQAYSMEHGDVIVSEMTRKKPNDRVVTDIIASAKTLAVLQASQPINAVSNVGGKSSGSGASDPWADNDPWAGYAPIN